MQRGNILRWILATCLGAALVFAAWAWLRPYAWRPDPKARCRIEETLVTPDQSYCWLDVHLKVLPDQSHDLSQPVRLMAGSNAFDLADITLGGDDPANPRELWFKFWIDRRELAEPLILKINGSSLTVKANHGMPAIPQGGFRNFTSNRW